MISSGNESDQMARARYGSVFVMPEPVEGFTLTMVYSEKLQVF